MSTYLVAFERNGERHFATSRRGLAVVPACRMFGTRKEAEALRNEVATQPGITAAYVVTCGEGK